MLSPAPIQTSSLSTITSSTASPDAGPNSRASATARFCASKRRGAACGAAAGSSSSMTNGSAAQLPARRGRLRSRSSLALARGGGGSASAPWGKLGDGVHTWLRNAAEADAEAAPALRSLDWHLRSLAAARDTPAPECYYTWPWPHQEQRPTRAAASSTISVAARA